MKTAPAITATELTALRKNDNCVRLMIKIVLHSEISINLVFVFYRPNFSPTLQLAFVLNPDWRASADGAADAKIGEETLSLD